MEKDIKYTPDRCQKIESQILTTRGMSSAVFNPIYPSILSMLFDDKMIFKHIGHISAFDYDGTPFDKVEKIAKSELYIDSELAELFKEFNGMEGQFVPKFPGVSAIFRSSEGSYHLWNLTIRGLYLTHIIGAKSKCDHAHNAYSCDRHCWILRIVAKENKDRTSYKPAPELVRVLYEPTNKIQSLPHFRLLQALALDADPKYKIKIPSTKDIMFDGVSLNIEGYKTITDKMKANWQTLQGD